MSEGSYADQAPRNKHQWGRLHYAKAGDGPLMVCLHGFPEFWYSWHHQMEAPSSAGYRVVAPDLRGYNESSKPTGRLSYGTEVLVDDVVGLIAHLGEDRAVIVGHDGGGMIAWAVAAHRPASVHAMVALNAPHPLAWTAGLWDPRQALRSWYMLLFQLPWLPEALARRRNFALADRMLGEVANADAFSREDIALYKRAIAQPSALAAALNYYRAMRDKPSRGMLFPPPSIDAPRC